MEQPQTRYADANGVHLAYQVVGVGPDLVFMPNWFSNVEIIWENPLFRVLIERLGSFCRVIMFDPRGSGVSDPVAIGDMLELEERATDIRTVLDAVGSERAIVLGCSFVVRLACFFAASHADRTAGLILIDGSPRAASGMVREAMDERIFADMTERWPTPEFGLLPSSFDQSVREWGARYRRLSIAPGAAKALLSASLDIDVVEILPSIYAPTLVIHHPHATSGVYDPADGAVLVDHIEGARLIELDGDARSWFSMDGVLLDHVEEFVTGARATRRAERVLATLLFADIVASTEHMARVGDRLWAATVQRYHEIVRSTIQAHDGQVVDTAGDGIFARLEGPARAIQCAVELRRALRPIGVEVRSGIHTGEIEIDNGAVRGIGVHIAARICAIATADEVLVSSTVKDLVTGAKIAFADRGEHDLKGVPEVWRLYAVNSMTTGGIG